MRRARSTTLTALATTALLAFGAAPSGAGDAGWRPKPAIPQATKCVADPAWMRRNHMRALGHQRDATVRDGVRTIRFSLKGCVDCHAVAGADGKPVAYASDQHFCRTCHDYAAVRVDCFECHASRPPASGGTAADDASAAKTAIARYLKDVGR